ncbi:MAG: ThuA domain-containing protein [Phycisphaerales bacterium]|jgi:uncharacterized protein|nr:ThuA domain-containing protein [Phycisphaerales bacterium]
MRFLIRIVLAALVVGVGVAGAADKASPAAGGKTAVKPIRVIILVGGHGYDKKNFEKAWGGHADITCEVWKGKPYTLFDDISKFDYDVIMTFNLSSGITEKQKANFLALLGKGVGMVAWHHSLANCQNWAEYEKIVGCKYWMKPGEKECKKVGKSGYAHDRYQMKIADADHPITKGMKDFQIDDESYYNQTFTTDAMKVLVTTEHPKSDKPIAWTNDYKGARIFGYQGGHDAKAWNNPGHRRLLGNGIRWAAGRKCVNTPMAAPVLQKQFKTLGETVAFIGACLDKKDYKTLAAAFDAAPTQKAFAQLAAVHAKTPLVKLYAEKKFPAKGGRFTLGGPGKELGGMKIDLRKFHGAWLLRTMR